MRKEEKHTDELYQKVDDTMALLDLDATAPSNLAAKIMARKGELDLPKVRRLNITSYIQIAAAALFGIFIGHQFGKLANTHVPKAKQDSISQYFKAHHFNVEDDAAKSNPFYIKH